LRTGGGGWCCFQKPQSKSTKQHGGGGGGGGGGVKTKLGSERTKGFLVDRSWVGKVKKAGKKPGFHPRNGRQQSWCFAKLGFPWATPRKKGGGVWGGGGGGVLVDGFWCFDKGQKKKKNCQTFCDKIRLQTFCKQGGRVNPTKGVGPAGGCFGGVCGGGGGWGPQQNLCFFKRASLADTKGFLVAKRGGAPQTTPQKKKKKTAHPPPRSVGKKN